MAFSGKDENIVKKVVRLSHEIKKEKKLMDNGLIMPYLDIVVCTYVKVFLKNYEFHVKNNDMKLYSSAELQQLHMDLKDYVDSQEKVIKAKEIHISITKDEAEQKKLRVFMKNNYGMLKIIIDKHFVIMNSNTGISLLLGVIIDTIKEKVTVDLEYKKKLEVQEQVELEQELEQEYENLTSLTID